MAHRLIVSALAVVFSCSSALTLAEQNPPKATTQGQPPGQNQGQSSDAGSSNAQPHPKGREDAADRERPRDEPDIYEKTVAWSAIVQAGSAFVVMVITGLLAYYNWGLLAATKTAADAAKASADTARDTLMLTAADVKILKSCWNGAPILHQTQVSVQFKNFGQSEARDLVCDLNLGVKGTPISGRLPQSEPVGLGPGQSLEYAFEPLGTILPKDDLISVHAGSLALDLWGTISYRDVFGRRHVLEYQARHIPRTDAFTLVRHSTGTGRDSEQ